MKPILFWLPVIAWQLSSIAVIFCNKHLYSSTFPYPITLMVMHMVLSSLATRLFVRMGLISVPRMNWGTYCTTVIPLGALFATSVSLSNLAAARLPIASTQMLKGLAPIFILFVMLSTGIGKLRPGLIPVILFLTVGGLLVNFGDFNFDPVGVSLQLSNLLCEAVRIMAIKFLLDKHMSNASPLSALALFAPICAFFLFPVAVTFEPLAFPVLYGSNYVLALVAISSTFALGLNCCNVWALSRDTGPLILSIAGVIKDMSMLIISIVCLGNEITVRQTAGYGCALFGIIVYRNFSSPGGSDLSMFDVINKSVFDPTTKFISIGILAILGLSNNK